MKPINIFYAQAGNGHKYAALAVKEALDQEDLSNTVIDVLAFAGSFFKWSCSTVYDLLGEHCRPACKITYRLTDRDRRSSRLVQKIDELSEKELSPLIDYVIENRIQTAVCTHFFPATILSRMKRRGLYAGKIYVVVTDYGLHRMWFTDPCDRYFVAGNEVREQLHTLGVDDRRIALTGIPIRGRFAIPRARSVLAQELGLAMNRPTVLIIASALPDSFVIRVLDTIMSSSRAMNLMVVAGRNRSLLERLDRFHSTDSIALHRYGYVEEMERLMGAADLLVTKPGGLIISEAFSTATPMILTHAIPYQETANADYAVRKGTALGARSAADVAGAIGELLESPGKLMNMRRNARKLASPGAAHAIVKAIRQDITPLLPPILSPADSTPESREKSTP